jgi:hypothetical protein
MRIPEYYRQKLYKALLGPIWQIPRGETARTILEEVASHELDSIEPIIEDMIDYILAIERRK